ncbi:MAG: hypothetical protein WCG85_09900 [Polyangia bacterium]
MREAPNTMPEWETMKVLVGLIEEQLDLKGRVVIYNQQWEIPADDGLLVEISFLGEKPFGQGTHYETTQDDDGADQFWEINEQITQESLGITLYSKGPAARTRRQEIVFALQSTAAQQLAEKYGFRFGFLPTSFVDASETEGSGRLNKYAYSFNVLRAHIRRRIVQYFDKFTFPPSGTKTLIVNP